MSALQCIFVFDSNVKSEAKRRVAEYARIVHYVVIVEVSSFVNDAILEAREQSGTKVVTKN